MKTTRSLLLALLVLTASCGGGGAGDDDVTVDAGASVDAPPGTALRRLIVSDYSIPAGMEFYQCQRVTVTEALDILTIKPVSPTGVHHEVFAIDESGLQPDGVTRCGPLGSRWRTLFASGVNSPQLDMPPGIALRVPAGAQLVLGLHLFNTSSSVLTGRAALDVLAATDATGLKEAGVPFAGNPSFTVPVAPPHEVQGVCTVDRATKFFAVFPHMHQTGAHMKVWVTGSIGTRTVWDEPYDFNDQRFGQFAPIELAAGDQIHMTCTYSAAGAGKSFGDSSLSEMCFAISYVSPPIASAGSLCSN
ncbi:MAG: hypothetical protein IT370_34565 [Deltaproteobacteria bacterium]|nr:hypothetical protein [Deltaproteobacteria bacterium]